MDIKGQRYNATPTEAYDIGTSAIYVGYATRGANQAVAAWTIKKITLDASGNPTKTEWSAENAAVWNNRASETYT